MNSVEIGNRIRELREARSLTLLEMQRLTGINNGSLSKIENGKQAVTPKSMSAICQALGIETAELFSKNRNELQQHQEKPAHTSAIDAVGSTGIPVSKFERTTDIPGNVNVAIGTLEARPNASRGGVDIGVTHQKEILFLGAMIRKIEAAPSNLGAFEIPDDMMAPRLAQGDSVVVDLGDKEVPATGGVFAVVLDSETICVRRVLPYLNKGLRILCDNPAYPEMTLNAAQAASIVIAGRVKGLQSTNGF